MTLSRVGTLGLVLMLAISGSTEAQNRVPAGEHMHERILEISPLAGVFIPDSNIQYSEGAPLAGIRLGLNSSHRWGIEGYFTYSTGLDQEYREGMLKSYQAQPVYDTIGRPIGAIVTQMQTQEDLQRAASEIVTVGGDAVLNLSTKKIRPFLLVGAGFIDDIANEKESPPGPFSDLYLTLGAGLKLYRSSGMGLRIDVRDMILEKGNLPRENPRAALTAAEYDLQSGGGDDGVIGQEPYAPDESRGLRWLHNVSVQVSLTIPLGYAWKDGDADRVATRFDKCPTTAPGVVVDRVGCGIDSDSDGVFDGLDQCADTPFGATVDLTGCPSDADEDGVLDGLDSDDSTPLGAFVDARGAHYDTDGDGVWDGLDECNDTPRGLEVGPSGCAADQVERRLLTGETLVVPQIQFELGSAEIEPASYHFLNKRAFLLEHWTGNPDRPLRLELGVHTDGLGDADANKRLTQRQADALLTYLLENFSGMGANNLVAVGYGEEFPIATDDTAESRQRNRRVEIRMISEGDPPESYDYGAGSVGPPDDGTSQTAPEDTPGLPEEPALPDEGLPEPDFPDIDPE